MQALMLLALLGSGCAGMAVKQAEQAAMAYGGPGTRCVAGIDELVCFGGIARPGERFVCPAGLNWWWGPIERDCRLE
jgi:hypothetical protein